MTQKDINYKELLTFGWDNTKKHFWFLFISAVVYLAITIAVSDVRFFRDFISGLLSVAFIALSLVIARGKVPHYKDALAPFKTYKVFWHYFLSSCLYILAFIAGLILLILPGVYIATRLQFFVYSIVENENLGPIEALKKSMKMTEGLFWKLFWFGCIVILVNIAGALLLGVGLFFTVPVTGIAYAELYRKLSGQAHEVTVQE